MGQYYKAVMLVEDRKNYTNNRALVFSFPGSAKLTEHAWNGNRDVSEAMRALKDLSAETNLDIRVAWVGDYSKDFYKAQGADFTDDYHREGFTAAWGEYVSIPVLKHAPAYGKLYAVNDDMKEAVEIWGLNYDGSMEREHGNWWMCAWPILNAVGNGLYGGDYHGVNEEHVGRWAYDRQRILDHIPRDYDVLPAHLFSDEGLSEIPAEEVDL